MIQETALSLFYQRYMAYFSGCIFGLIKGKVSPKLLQAQKEFLAATQDVLNYPDFDESDALIESIAQLTQSIHQLVKTGFSSEIRGELHHPLEDLLNRNIAYLNSLDPRAKNDPILFALEDEIESISEIQRECEIELPEDAAALSSLLANLKDLALCMHSLGSLSQ